MLVEGRVGPQSSGENSTVPLRVSRMSAVVTTDAHGRYTEAVVRGSVFIASNVAAQAVSVALATTYTGLCVSNPIGSGRNLAILGFQYAISVAPAAIASIHLIGGFSGTTNVTHTTPLAAPGIQNCMLGGALGVAKADSAATIVNPGYLIGAGSGFTAAALYATTPSWIDLGGLIICPPGGWVAVGALTAVTGFGTIAWEEINP
jgi:hypothetical protein